MSFFTSAEWMQPHQVFESYCQELETNATGYIDFSTDLNSFRVVSRKLFDHLKQTIVCKSVHNHRLSFLFPYTKEYNIVFDFQNEVLAEISFASPYCIGRVSDWTKPTRIKYDSCGYLDTLIYHSRKPHNLQTDLIDVCIHRDNNLPAIIKYNKGIISMEIFYFFGKIHSFVGPAMIDHQNNQQYFFFEGVPFDEPDWRRIYGSEQKVHSREIPVIWKQENQCEFCGHQAYSKFRLQQHIDKCPGKQLLDQLLQNHPEIGLFYQNQKYLPLVYEQLAKIAFQNNDFDTLKQMENFKLYDPKWIKEA